MIAFLARPVGSRYNMVFLQMTPEHPVQPLLFPHPPGQWYDLRVAPDARYLLATLNHGATTIYCIPFPSLMPYRLPSYFAADTVLGWDADHRLLLQAQTHNPHLHPYGRLYTMRPDGQEKVFVTPRIPSAATLWSTAHTPLSARLPIQYTTAILSHTGAYLAVVPSYHTDTVAVIDMQTEQRTNIFCQKHRHIKHLTWSPDDSQITFLAESLRTTSDVLYSVDWRTHVATPIVCMRFAESYWVWSPTSLALAFRKQKRQHAVLAIYDRQSGQIRELMRMTGMLDPDTNEL
jgi:hypothetical protein